MTRIDYLKMGDPRTTRNAPTAVSAEGNLLYSEFVSRALSDNLPFRFDENVAPRCGRGVHEAWA